MNMKLCLKISVIILAIFPDQQTTGTTTVIVTIQDLNDKEFDSEQVVQSDVKDNCPSFFKGRYSVSIFETISVGTDILQMFLADRDIGENAIAYFSRINGAGNDTKDFFDVGQQFGRIYVKKSLERHPGTFKFFVRATDKIGSGCSKNTSFTVLVLQTSANTPPVWGIQPKDNMTIFIHEEQYEGTLVYDVLARDNGSDVNDFIEYCFVYNGIDTHATPNFTINKINGIIRSNIVFDREKIDTYVLILKAMYYGRTKLETTRLLTVVTLDVNDNSPVFMGREYQIDISKNQPLGDVIRIPSASDLDLNRVIYYDIICATISEYGCLDS